MKILRRTLRSPFRKPLLSLLLIPLSFSTSSVFAVELHPGDNQNITYPDVNNPTPLQGGDGPLFEVHTTGGVNPIILNVGRRLEQTTTRVQAAEGGHPTEFPPFNTHNSAIAAHLPVGAAPVTLTITQPISSASSVDHNPTLAHYSPALGLAGNWTTNLRSTINGDVQFSFDTGGNNATVLNLENGAVINGNVFTTAVNYPNHDYDPTVPVGTINFLHQYTTAGSMRGLAAITMDTAQAVNVSHTLQATHFTFHNGTLVLNQNGALVTPNTITNNATIQLSGGSFASGVNGTGSIQVLAGAFAPQGNISGQRIVMNDGTSFTVNNGITISGNQAIELQGQSTMRLLSGGTVTSDIVGGQHSTLRIETAFTPQDGRQIQAGNIHINSAGGGGSLTTSATSPISGFTTFEIHPEGSAAIAGNMTSHAGGSIVNRGNLVLSGGIITANALSNQGNLTVQGGTINTPISNLNQNSTITIAGGTFNRTVQMLGGRARIVGGTFNEQFQHNGGEVVFHNSNINAPAGFANNAKLALEGTSTITGHYSQTNAGVLTTTLTDAHHFGNLHVSGNAVLDPGATLQISLAPNYTIRDGDVFDIITAGNGNFANANIVTPDNPAFRFRQEIAGNRLRLTATKTDYLVHMADTPHNATVARAVEHLRLSQNPSDRMLINFMDHNNLSRQTLNNLFAGISPNNTRELFFAGITPVRMAVRKAENRLSWGRIGSRNGGNRNQNLLSLDNAHVMGFNSGYAAGDCNPYVSFGPMIFGNYTKQRKIDSLKGFTAGTEGFGLLADMSMTNCLQVGVGALYANSQVRGHKNSGTMNINSLEGIVYGGYNWHQAFVDVSMVAAENWYRNRRHIPMAKRKFLVNSKHRGFQYSGKLLTGYDWCVGRFIFTPLASIEYFHLHQGSFLERGVINRFCSSSNAHLGQAGAGLKLSFIEDSERYVPEIHALFLRDLNNPRLQTTSQFTGGGGPAFLLAGPVNLPKNSVNLGFGITAFIYENVLFTTTYDFEGKRRYRSHSGTARLRWLF